MVVETVFDIVVCNAEGWLGSTTCSNCGTKIRNWIYTWNVCYKHIYRNVSRTTGFIFPI